MAHRGVQAVEQQRRVQIAHVRVRYIRRAIVALLARAVEVFDEAVIAILLRVGGTVAVLLLQRVARLEESPRLAVVVEAVEELPQLRQRRCLPRGTRREVVVVNIDPRVLALLRRAAAAPPGSPRPPRPRPRPRPCPRAAAGFGGRPRPLPRAAAAGAAAGGSSPLSSELSVLTDASEL